MLVVLLRSMTRTWCCPNSHPGTASTPPPRACPCAPLSPVHVECRAALHCNHKWALDGGDPASYAGVLWCFGESIKC
jgi:hypothetical protein